MNELSQLDSIWNEVLQLMAAELAKTSFDSWLKNSKPVQVAGNILYIELPNEFTKDWVEARYANPLQKTLRQVVNREFDLRFVIPKGIKSLASQASQMAQIIGEQPETNSISDELTVRRETPSSILNPRYSFDTFVVGNSNRFAHAASLAVAEGPAKAYNPLFLYGGVGLGKTHLMHAIGHHALMQTPGISVVYVTSETFTNELITAIGQKSMIEFRNKYRKVDILLVDDIQFLARKESTQEEFFHTFNALYEAERQLVISSDRPPKDIPTLEERLRSRFEWGLITDIQPPDLETRIAILKNKANLENQDIGADVLNYIATNIQSNIRELEGALIRIAAYANLHNVPVSMDVVIEALKDIIKAPFNRPINIADIQKVVADHFGIKILEMKSKKRTRNITYPRQIAMYLARELTDSSLPEIGAEFGGRDHTTVIHAYDKIESELKLDPFLQTTIKELINLIQRT